jgi:hypothetical protein
MEDAEEELTDAFAELLLSLEEWDWRPPAD